MIFPHDDVNLSIFVCNFMWVDDVNKNSNLKKPLFFEIILDFTETSNDSVVSHSYKLR